MPKHKPDKEKRTITIGCNLTESEYERLSRYLRERMTTQAMLLRHLLRGVIGEEQREVVTHERA